MKINVAAVSATKFIVSNEQYLSLRFYDYFYDVTPTLARKGDVERLCDALEGLREQASVEVERYFLTATLDKLTVYLLSPLKGEAISAKKFTFYLPGKPFADWLREVWFAPNAGTSPFWFEITPETRRQYQPRLRVSLSVNDAEGAEAVDALKAVGRFQAFKNMLRVICKRAVANSAALETDVKVSVEGDADDFRCKINHTSKRDAALVEARSEVRFGWEYDFGIYTVK